VKPVSTPRLGKDQGIVPPRGGEISPHRRT
jgi:hypothetical protein